MKDGLLGLSTAILVVGWMFVFQRSVDAHHSGWVFFVEVISVLIGLASVQKFEGRNAGKDQDESKAP